MYKEWEKYIITIKQTAQKWLLKAIDAKISEWSLRIRILAQSQLSP